MAFSVFLSHTGKDRVWIQSVAAQLKSVGIQSYLYEYDHQYGEYIDTKMHRAIDTCDAVVTLLTNGTESKPYIHQEIGYAIAKKKIIIPLVASDFDTNNLGMLAGREFIPFHPDDTIPELQTYLKKLSDKKATEELLIGIAIIVGVMGVAYLAYNPSSISSVSLA